MSSQLPRSRNGKRLHAAVVGVLLVSSKGHTEGCGFFGKNGVDYADENLSLVSINSTHPLASCCQACTAWNAQKKQATNCSIGVSLYGHRNENICALKASSAKPFPSANVTAVKPPSPGPPHPSPGPPTFRFSSVFGDGMVLQSAPQRAQIWGFCESQLCDPVTVQFGATTLEASVSGRIWHVNLPPTSASMATAHEIAATSSGTTIRFSALFGDVWVCSGKYPPPFRRYA